MDLNRYLEEARDEGEIQGEGSFTLERGRALEKLANFTLPDEAAWAVKIVQAAVSSGVTGSIVVRLGSKETSLTFAATEVWSLDAIEEAFYNPKPQPEPHLNHLKCALWFTGIASRRAFQIDLPGQDEALVWNGVRLRRVKAKAEVSGFRLAVTPLGVGALKAPWVGRKLLTSERNLGLKQSLANCCCVCPLPLVVDGQRLDGLELLPGRGWGEDILPLCLLPGTADLPPFSLPPGTLERQAFPRSQEARVMTLISAMLEKRTGGWDGRRELCLFAWVQDGALIQQEKAPVHSTACAATIFLSAEGLRTDLTGFQVAMTPEKERREREALRAAAESAKALVPYSQESIKYKSDSTAKAMGLVLVALGLGTAPLALGVGATFLTSGFVSAVLERSRKQNFKKWLASEYDLLARNLRSSAS